mmetsp:Transcript_57603/g.66511  ORF Transcript_57603/g.66511 Transcript_57603/m.66511 type:complete len:85 (+) Transcript_57603:729-983(+)
MLFNPDGDLVVGVAGIVVSLTTAIPTSPANNHLKYRKNPAQKRSAPDWFLPKFPRGETSRFDVVDEGETIRFDDGDDTNMVYAF